MEKSEAIKILGKVKANWYRQPTDRVVQNEWAEALLATGYEDAYRAVNAWRDSGSPEAPTVGQLAVDAAEFAKQREDARRAKLYRLDEPKPSAEEIKRNKSILRSIIDKLGG